MGRCGHPAVLVATVFVTSSCLSKDNPVHGLTDGDDAGSSSNGDVTSSSGGSSTGGAGTSNGSDPSGPGMTSTTSSTSAGSDTASTGEPIPQGRCGGGNLIYEELFDDVPMSSLAWDVQPRGTAIPSIQAGALYVGVQVSGGGPDSYWVLVGQDTIPAQGATGVQVVQPPAPGDEAEVYLGINDAQSLIYVSASQGDLQTWWYDYSTFEYTDLHAVPYDPQQHRWVRVAWDAFTAAVVFETSADGQIWEFFHEVDANGFGFGEGYLETGIGAWAGPVTDPVQTGAMDDFFVCAGP